MGGRESYVDRTTSAAGRYSVSGPVLSCLIILIDRVWLQIHEAEYSAYRADDTVVYRGRDSLLQFQSFERYLRRDGRRAFCGRSDYERGVPEGVVTLFQGYWRDSR